MFLIVGLGNPGKEYENTRHNIGREIVMRARQLLDLPEFKPWPKGKAEISQGEIGKERVLLFLPNTGMNASGTVVASIRRFFKIKPQNIFVLHDDADIALGSAKLSFGKNSAGHKGVESVIRTLKTNEFWRFRIGIAGKRDVPAEKLVLKKFTPEETRIVRAIIKKTIEALCTMITESPERAMNDYNR